MFRDSDYEYPRVHRVEKPIPALQQVSQGSKLEDNKAKNQQSTVFSAAPEVVPSKFSSFYDPKNPKADWAGFVDTSVPERRHCSNHRSQMTGIQYGEGGIVSIEDQKEFPIKRRTDRVAEPFKTDLISGIAPKEDDRWKTNYQSLAVGDKTDISQLTLVKQANGRKAVPAPATYNNSGDNHYYPPMPPPKSKGSFLSSIGASLVNSGIPDPPRRAVDDNVTSIQPIAGYTGRRGRRPNT